MMTLMMMMMMIKMMSSVTLEDVKKGATVVVKYAAPIVAKKLAK